MAERPQMYSVEEFHCMFPGVEVDRGTWDYWLRKWRDARPPRLVRNIHWMFVMQGEKKNIPVRVYLPKPVLRCILEDSSACYFMSQFDGVYGNKIRAYLSGSVTGTIFLDSSSEATL